MVDKELGAASEQVCQRSAAFVGLEAVVLLDPNSGELLPLPGQLVAAPGQLLLGLEQLEPGRKPLLTRSCRVLRHRVSLPLGRSGFGIALLFWVADISGQGDIRNSVLAFLSLANHYVAFLRGINVGRAKRIAMADLRSFAKVGFVMKGGTVYKGP